MSLLPPNKNPDVRLLDTIKELETELATLRAKAEAYDKGRTAWAVFNNRTGSFSVCWEDQEAAQDMTVDFNNMSTKDRYTCRNVRVCEEVSQ